jgi:hypothetical protein
MRRTMMADGRRRRRSVASILGALGKIVVAGISFSGFGFQHSKVALVRYLAS